MFYYSQSYFIKKDWLPFALFSNFTISFLFLIMSEIEIGIKLSKVLLFKKISTSSLGYQRKSYRSSALDCAVARYAANASANQILKK